MTYPDDIMQAVREIVAAACKCSATAPKWEAGHFDNTEEFKRALAIYCKRNGGDVE